MSYTVIGNMDKLTIESLIESNHAVHRWYPQDIYKYRNAFKLDPLVENCTALRKNLSYSMQYLEFLEKEIKELKLSSVLCVMLYKTYIITGMSVLEGLFTNIVKSHNWWKTTKYESVKVSTSNETKIGNETYVTRTEVLKIISPKMQNMNLDDLIKKLDRHHDALMVDHLVYPSLKRLKNLRNRVHLQMSDSNSDHDYNAFGLKEKKEMGEILYYILTSKMVTDSPEVFDFLNINLDNE